MLLAVEGDHGQIHRALAQRLADVDHGRLPQPHHHARMFGPQGGQRAVQVGPDPLHRAHRDAPPQVPLYDVDGSPCLVRGP